MTELEVYSIAVIAIGSYAVYLYLRCRIAIAEAARCQRILLVLMEGIHQHIDGKARFEYDAVSKTVAFRELDDPTTDATKETT